MDKSERLGLREGGWAYFLSLPEEYNPGPLGFSLNISRDIPEVEPELEDSDRFMTVHKDTTRHSIRGRPALRGLLLQGLFCGFLRLELDLVAEPEVLHQRKIWMLRFELVQYLLRVLRIR